MTAEISCKQSLFSPTEDLSLQPQGQETEPDKTRGERRKTETRSKCWRAHPTGRPPRAEGTSSYLGGIGIGDLAVSPRLRKAARTFSVSSWSPSSSEPAMGAPVREGAEVWTPGLSGK